MAPPSALHTGGRPWLASAIFDGPMDGDVLRASITQVPVAELQSLRFAAGTIFRPIRWAVSGKQWRRQARS